MIALRTTLIAATLILSIVAGRTSLAQPAEAAVPLYHFALPEQALVDSLAEFSRIVKQSVVFNPAQLQGLTAPALNAQLSAPQAIIQLLSGTSLVAQAVHQGWLVKKRNNIEAFDNAITNAATTDEVIDEVVDEIVVTGHYSHSLHNAIEQKRHAEQRIDVILAEDIGKFPALNIAEALKRSSGVSVIRDRGEALFISIRGLPSQFNLVTLNGHALATNENVRTSEQYGRRFHYDTIPAELVAGVDVKKSPVAADIDGAIGGSINIRTFKPLDVGKRVFTVNSSLAQSALAGETDPRVSTLASWINEDGNFGVLLATSHIQRSLRQDRALNFRWQEFSGSELPGATADTIISPGGVRPTLELETRKRRGVSAALQWRPSDDTQWELNVLDLDQHIDYQEFSYSADYSLDSLDPDSVLWRGNALIAGQSDSGSVQISRETAGLVDQNRVLDINLESSLNEWRYQARLALSKARSYNDKPIRRTRLWRQGSAGFRFFYPLIDAADVPTIQYQNLSLQQASDFSGRRLEWRRNDAEDRSRSFSFEITRPMMHPIINSLSAGIHWNHRSRDYQRQDVIITQGIEGIVFSEQFFLPFDSVLPDDTQGFLSESGGILPQQWLIPNEALFWQQVNTALDSRQPSNQDLLNSYNIEEDINALFVQLNMDKHPWQANVGLRYTYSDQQSRGYWLNADTENGALPVGFSKQYDYFLPSANATIALTDQILGRFAFARTINRPDFHDIAPRLTLHSGDELSAVGGNPQLEATSAWQYDAALEWYFSNRNLLSVALFYKTLSGFIQTDISTITINQQQYELQAKTNGGKAAVKGLELDYQQVFNHFPVPSHAVGISANFTVTDSQAEYHNGDAILKDELADVARKTVNLGLFYETPCVNARINYSWRDQALSEVGTYNLAAQNSAAFGMLDAQVSIKLNSHLMLVAEGINLNNAAEQEFVADNEFAGYTFYGRTLILGLRLVF